MLTTKEMYILEKNSEYFGVSCSTLMENAGKGIAEFIGQNYAGKKVVIVCYHGNNGGDGFVAARHLGCDVFFVGRKEKLTGDGLKNFKKLKKKQFVKSLEGYDVIVDALLGVGFSGTLKEPIVSIVKRINKLDVKKICVDVPTGISSDTGVGKLFVKPDIVLTMHDLKPGLKKFGKKVHIVDIGILQKAVEQVGAGEMWAILRKRKSDGHKGEHGRVLVATGSLDYPGAAILVSQALVSMRSGVDLVTLVAPRETALVANIFLPDLITKKLDGDVFEKKHVREVLKLAKNSDAVVIGPGLGIESKEFVKQIVKKCKNLVLDADALKSVSIKDLDGCIVTPHVKEFELLTGQKVPDVLEDKIKIVLKYSKKNCILLKGNPDIIAFDGKYKLNYTGNAGMTVGGTGDVLAGLCAGFLAQSDDLFLSACAAAFVNGLAGDALNEELGYGFIASDVSKEIAKVIQRFTKV